MARILFIENRGKTRFWVPVATALARRGHAIAWIVQNPVYRPPAAAGAVHVLPFPPTGPRARLPVGGDDETWVQALYPALVGDRGRRHFHGQCSHYRHYDAEIRALVEQVQPDVVIGEPTLFHELLAVGICRERGIPYLHPTATRYPGGRFTVFEGDSQQVIGGSGERMPAAAVRELAEAIAGSRALPSYMARPRGLDRVKARIATLQAQALAWSGHLRGERFNTPSLAAKRALDQAVRRNLERWRMLQRLPDDPARTLLHALQMQPEANLDVWGRPHRDQPATIRAMLAAAPADVAIAVKANPKSKYEVSDELLALAAAEPRVRLLPLDMAMPAAQALTCGALTVTGTMGFEALFGKGRTLSLCHPLIEAQFPQFHAASVAEGVARLLADPDAGRGCIETGIRLVQAIMAQSFPGVVSEPLYDPRCMAPANVEQVAAVLDGLISRTRALAAAA